MYSKVLYNSIQLVIYKDTLTVGNRIEGRHWRSMGFTPGVIPQPGSARDQPGIICLASFLRPYKQWFCCAGYYQAKQEFCYAGYNQDKREFCPADYYQAERRFCPAGYYQASESFYYRASEGFALLVTAKLARVLLPSKRRFCPAGYCQAKRGFCPAGDY